MAKPKNLAEAMEILGEAIERGENFSSADFDLFIEAIIRVAFPENERSWLHEIVTTSGFPRWAIIMAGWRMAYERFECPTLPSFVDRHWEEMILAEAAAEKTSEART